MIPSPDHPCAHHACDGCQTCQSGRCCMAGPGTARVTRAGSLVDLRLALHEAHSCGVDHVTSLRSLLRGALEPVQGTATVIPPIAALDPAPLPDPLLNLTRSKPDPINMED